jgi:hypothetical protein
MSQRNTEMLYQQDVDAPWVAIPCSSLFRMQYVPLHAARPMNLRVFCRQPPNRGEISLLFSLLAANLVWPEILAEVNLGEVSEISTRIL